MVFLQDLLSILIVITTFTTDTLITMTTTITLTKIIHSARRDQGSPQTTLLLFNNYLSTEHTS